MLASSWGPAQMDDQSRSGDSNRNYNPRVLGGIGDISLNGNLIFMGRWSPRSWKKGGHKNQSRTDLFPRTFEKGFYRFSCTFLRVGTDHGPIEKQIITSAGVKGLGVGQGFLEILIGWNRHRNEGWMLVQCGKGQAFKNVHSGASLVVQWLRIRLLM